LNYKGKRELACIILNEVLKPMGFTEDGILPQHFTSNIKNFHQNTQVSKIMNFIWSAKNPKGTLFDVDSNDVLEPLHDLFASPKNLLTYFLNSIIQN
jgi:hypothetical protein